MIDTNYPTIITGHYITNITGKNDLNDVLKYKHVGTLLKVRGKKHKKSTKKLETGDYAYKTCKKKS